MGALVDLKQIRYVITAAECRSFRRAAQHLEVQPSAVSKRILELEKRLGVALFARAHSGVTVTEAGECFVMQARRGLAQLDAAAALAKAMGRREFGIVRIGLFSQLANGFLAELVKAHLRRVPDIRLYWSEGTQSEHICAVEAHELDVAFVSGGPVISGCETVQLWDERLFVVMPAGQQLAGKAEICWPDLYGQHFVLCESELGRQLHDYLVRHLSDIDHQVSMEHCRVQRDNLLQLVAWERGLSMPIELSPRVPK